MTAWFHESTDPGERRQEQEHGQPLYRVDFNLSNLCTLLDINQAEALAAWLNDVGTDAAYDASADIERAIIRSRAEMEIEDHEAKIAQLRARIDEHTDPEELNA